MSCQACSSDWFLAKLGRCRQCMALSALLLVIGLVALWWCQQRPLVYQLMAALVAIAAALLLAAHLIMAGYYWLRESK